MAGAAAAGAGSSGAISRIIPGLTGDLQRIYGRAVEALGRDNFDYAIEMLGLVLERAPAEFEVRRALRAAQQGKGKSGGLFGATFGRLGALSLVTKGRAALHSDPHAAMEVAEQILNSDGFSPDGHKLFADAAIAAKMPREAILSLELLVRASPKDKKLGIQLAEAYADSGQKAKGEAVLEGLQRYHPGDIEVSVTLKNISARKTLEEGGYANLTSGNGNFREALREGTPAGSPVDPSKAWEAELRAEPNNVRLLRSLAEHYGAKNEFDKALGFYDRITEITGGADAAIHKQSADLRVRKFDHAIEQLDMLDLEYESKLAQLQADKQSYRIEECRERAVKYPADLLIRFELGQLYFEAGKISDAITEFQKSQAAPNKRVQSLGFLAKCFERRGMNDLALKKLHEVLKERLPEGERKDLLYALGSLYEKLGKRAEAIELFKQIYEVDAGYRDVAKKIDDHYALGGD